VNTSFLRTWFSHGGRQQWYGVWSSAVTLLDMFLLPKKDYEKTRDLAAAIID
jgi:hypothetical protein